MDFTVDRWEPWSVDQACVLFAEAPFRWWISGGHALELHIGESWRRRPPPRRLPALRLTTLRSLRPEREVIPDTR